MFLCLPYRYVTALLLTAGIAFTQTGTSSLVGAISDPADAVIANAALTATDMATGATYSVVSTEDGLFRFNALLPGRYSVRVQAPGFKIYDVRDLVLASSETRNLGKLVLQ